MGILLGYGALTLVATISISAAKPTTTEQPTTYPTTTYPTTTYPTTTYPPTYPTTTMTGCKINGVYYPVGSHQVGDDRSSNWCYGYYCNANGEYYNWDNFNCHPTTTPPTTVPPTPGTDTPRGCVYQGRFYMDNTLIQEALDQHGDPCLTVYCDSKSQLQQHKYSCAIVG